MKKKLISLLQRKRHIVALSTILMTFIVMSCLFIDSVDITQMIDGKAVNYAKAGTTATFKMHGHIKVQGDPRNDKRLVFGFWLLRVGIWHKMPEFHTQKIHLIRI